MKAVRIKLSQISFLRKCADCRRGRELWLRSTLKQAPKVTLKPMSAIFATQSPGSVSVEQQLKQHGAVSHACVYFT